MRRAILVAAFLLAACNGSSERSEQASLPPPEPDTEKPATTPPDRPTAALSVVDPSGAPGPFALKHLGTLLIRVEGKNLRPGVHDVRVDVISPLGSVYAQLPAVLAADDSQRGSASAVLHVRGSSIQSFREKGSWQLVASIDGARLAAASVDLTE